LNKNCFWGRRKKTVLEIRGNTKKYIESEMITISRIASFKELIKNISFKKKDSKKCI